MRKRKENPKSKDWCYFTVAPKYRIQIDQEDLDRVRSKTWRVLSGTQKHLEVVTSIRIGKRKSRTLTLARFILGGGPNEFTCFRDCKRTKDYRKSNLIICSFKERQRMLPKRRTKTTSKYRGVSRDTNKWRASIQVDGKSYYIGRYATEKQAALAYDKAAREKFGKFAYQNIIEKTLGSRLSR